MQASLRGPIPVTTLQSIADFHLQGDVNRLAISGNGWLPYTASATLDNAAKDTFNAVDLLSKVNISNYTPAGGAQYPQTEYGMALKQVAQIAKAESVSKWPAWTSAAGTRTTPKAQRMANCRSCWTNSAGLASLYKDMGERAKKMTVVTMSEFGRRAQENGSGGTDHGHGNCMFVLAGHQRRKSLRSMAGTGGGQTVRPRRLERQHRLSRRAGRDRPEAAEELANEPGLSGLHGGEEYGNCAGVRGNYQLRSKTN